MERIYTRDIVLKVCLDLMAEGVYPSGKALAARLPLATEFTLLKQRNILAKHGKLPGFVPLPGPTNTGQRGEERDGIDPSTARGWAEYMRRRRLVFAAVQAKGRSLTNRELDRLLGPAPERKHRRNYERLGGEQHA